MTTNDTGSTPQTNSDAIVGTVVSGLGRGKEFVQLAGYRKQFDAQLGYEPFPGTLNLELETARSVLKDKESVVIDSWSDGDSTYGAVDCYPATVSVDDRGAESVHVIVPRRTDHDETTLEIIAPDNLRDALGLSDGSTVTVTPGTPEVTDPTDST